MWNCQQLIGMTVAAVDGEVGRLSDLCFDQDQWIIKYFVVDAGGSESKVLIALAGEDDAARAAVPDWAGAPATGSAGATVPTMLLDAPTLLSTGALTFGGGLNLAAAALPLSSRELFGEEESRRRRADLPAPFLGRIAAPSAVVQEGADGLRRVEEVRGYRVAATDGDVGQVEGFLIDEGSWAIQYVVIRVRDGESVKRVVIVPSWISSIDPESCRVHISMRREVVLCGPEFTDDVQEGYETWLFASLGRYLLAQAH